MMLIFLGIVPVAILYLACQKYIIKGVAAGAKKADPFFMHHKGCEQRPL